MVSYNRLAQKRDVVRKNEKKVFKEAFSLIGMSEKKGEED
jgi:hypothetical protein